MFNFLAELAVKRRKVILVLALLFFPAAGALGAGVADKLDPYGADDPDTESVQASDQLEAAGYRDAGVIVLVHDVDVTSSDGRERVEALTDQIKEDPDVASVDGFADSRSPAFVSEDGESTYLAVRLSPTEDDAIQDAGERIVDSLADDPNVLVGGFAVAQQQINEQTEEDLQRAELLVFPLLFLLSLLFFRTFIAAALPLLVGGLSIVSTFLMLSVLSEFLSISIFSLNITTGLGLGLAIDYSLFMVSRYREEIARTSSLQEAMRNTMRTSGRTVLFSSLTVAAAMASLTIFPQRFLYSMGLGGALVALIAAAISLLVLPAVLALLGHRVNSFSPKFLRRRAERDARPATQGFWYRLSQLVMRRPVVIAVSSAAVLIVLALPFARVVFTWVDPQVLPAEASANRVDDALSSEFPPHHDTPIRILVSGDGAEAKQIAARAEKIRGVAEVLPPQHLEGGRWIVEVISTGPGLSDESQEVVTDVRALAGTQVTGFTAGFMDFQDSLVEHIPLMLAIVGVATFVILFLMTGSVVLPLKQLIMNLLGLGAVFGILVLIFQDGRLEGALAYESVGALETTMPLLLFAMVFGLSTDYGVFLLSRIKEAHDGGASNTESVATGLERTGRIVTAAALLFAVAVGAFVTSEMIFIKENFLGVALGVLIDATIIRALLVPSLMRLLGEWNWWAPRPLRRLHARIGLSEA